MTAHDNELTILSMRRGQPSLGFSPVYEFEDQVARLMSAQVFEPDFRPDWQRSVLRGPLRDKISPMTLAKQPSGGKSLLVVVPTPAYLAGLNAVKDWRQKFDTVAALIIDSYQVRDYRLPKSMYGLDHIFTPILEDVELVEKMTGVPTSILPFGADALVEGSMRGSSDRPIDMIGFGRQPKDYDLPIREAFNEPGSGRFYLYSTIHSPTPISRTDERSVFWKTLRRANLSLAFCTLKYYHRKIPVSIVTPRWFESLNAGCVVIGKRPDTPLADQLLDWPDATIDVPDDPGDLVAFLEDLLAQPDRLDAARRESRRAFLTRHDIRYRVQDVLKVMGVEPSALLTQEMGRLKAIGRETFPETSGPAATVQGKA